MTSPPGNLTILKRYREIALREVTVLFFIYRQGLTGAGHVVRTDEIARALAGRHEVWVTDGGLPMPRPPLPPRVRALALPRIRRAGDALVPLDDSREITAVLGERRRLLLACLGRVRPDLLLVEHFPISKWELGEEILAVIETARRVNPAVRVVSSLRDISPRHRYDAGAEEHRRRALSTLQTHFDRLLIHTDPRFAAGSEHLPWLDELGIPVDTTGFVSQKPGGGGPGDGARAGSVVVSMGGAGDLRLGERAVAAWRLLHARGETGDRTLRVFLPLSADGAAARRLMRYGDGIGVRFALFAADFLEHLRHADLSLSHCGYNTAVNLLETRTRALVAPTLMQADQLPRARRLEEHALARVLGEADLEPEPLARAILAALARPRPAHAFNLDGAQRTCEILQAMCAAPAGEDDAARLADG